MIIKGCARKVSNLWQHRQRVFLPWFLDRRYFFLWRCSRSETKACNFLGMQVLLSTADFLPADRLLLLWVVFRYFNTAEPLISQCFYNLLLKFTGVSFVWYSFRHRKTPHFLVQVLYHTCLTNGVQFIWPFRFLFLLHRDCAGDYERCCFSFNLLLRSSAFRLVTA